MVGKLPQQSHSIGPLLDRAVSQLSHRLHYLTAYRNHINLHRRSISGKSRQKRTATIITAGVGESTGATDGVGESAVGVPAAVVCQQENSQCQYPMGNKRHVEPTMSSVGELRSGVGGTHFSGSALATAYDTV
jgi:hypothetical protein